MTQYPFTDEHFHTDKADWDHSAFVYEIDEGSLAIKLSGAYEVGELSMIREALLEANRLFKHRSWVEIESAQDEYGYTSWHVIVWRGGKPEPNPWVRLHNIAWQMLHNMCREGHADAHGWLKEGL